MLDMDEEPSEATNPGLLVIQETSSLDDSLSIPEFVPLPAGRQART